MKAAVITGSTSGIGLAATEELIEKDYLVVAVDKVPPIKIKEKVISITGDITNQLLWEEVCYKIEEKRLDVNCLVNSAAILDSRDTSMDFTPIEIWMQVINNNLIGTMIACKYMVPFLRNQKTSSITNIASIVALQGSQNPQFGYTASKGGIISFSKELAISEASSGIRVNCISPGLTKTPLTADLKGGQQKRSKNIPLSRWAEPEEIAKLIIFLSSSEASYITAANYIIDGGLVSLNPTTIDV